MEKKKRGEGPADCTPRPYYSNEFMPGHLGGGIATKEKMSIENDKGHCCAGCKYSKWYMGSAIICWHPSIKGKCSCERMKDYSEICDKYVREKGKENG